MEQHNKIGFGDLSGWLKTIVIISWIVAVTYAIAFLVGFIGALVA